MPLEARTLADQAVKELDHHLNEWTPERDRVETAIWALDAARRPQILHHFRLMRMGTIHANNPNEEFRKLVGELARFCTAASELPGLAESISGLCENVFDPLGYDYNIERHREAIVLAREDWPDLPRDGTGNMPLPRPAHEVADVTGSTVDAGGTAKAAVDTAGSAGGTAENVVDTPGGAVSAVRTDIHPRMKPIVDSAVKITHMSLRGAGAANAHVNDVAAPDKTIRVITRLFVDAAAYLAAEAVCDAGENDPLVDAITNDVIAKVICSVEAGTGIAYLDVEEVVNAHLMTILRPVTQDDPARLSRGVDIADVDTVDADMPDADIADADIADADADVEMVPRKVFLYVSDDCDVETTQALAKDMQSALVADKFPYRGNNRGMEANITMTEAEEIVNFVFYNINRLPLFVQHILQQIHGVPGDGIINAARYTTMDYTQYAVPSVVRLFASTWFESKFPEEQSVLRQVRRDVASVNLQATFEIFCDGLVGKHMAPRASWQFWARARASCSGPDVVGYQGSVDGTAVPERAIPWKRVAERALMAELDISECEWASATLEWSFSTPFVNAFGVGIIPIFIGYAEHPIKSFNDASMIPGIVGVIQKVDNKHGAPLQRLFHLVGKVVMDRVVDAMSVTGDEFRRHVAHIARPVDDETLLTEATSVCQRLSYFTTRNGES